MVAIINGKCQLYFPTAFCDVFKCPALSEHHHQGYSVYYHVDKEMHQFLIFKKLEPAHT